MARACKALDYGRTKMEKKHWRNKWKVILMTLICLMGIVVVARCNKKTGTPSGEGLVIVDQPMVSEQADSGQAVQQTNLTSDEQNETLVPEDDPWEVDYDSDSEGLDEQESDGQVSYEQAPEEPFSTQLQDAEGNLIGYTPLLSEQDSTQQLDPDGSYTSKEDVALYIHLYGRLPGNFITKKEAESLGWSGGSLEKYAPGKCIGGSHFGNYEGLLPEADGRKYTECDIDTLGKKSRGAKRIVFSNDGLIYYTEDHYETFELLYGEE